jgi:hypothetical protein
LLFPGASINPTVQMMANLVAPSPEGERATEIGVSALFGILLIGSLCGICYYVRKRRTRARLERDAIDMEHGTRNGSVSTLEVNWEKDLYPEADKEGGVSDGGCSGSIFRPNRHRNTGLTAGNDEPARVPTYAALRTPTLESETQLSKPEHAHLQN